VLDLTETTIYLYSYTWPESGSRAGKAPLVSLVFLSTSSTFQLYIYMEYIYKYIHAQIHYVTHLKAFIVDFLSPTTKGADACTLADPTLSNSLCLCFHAVPNV